MCLQKDFTTQQYAATTGWAPIHFAAAMSALPAESGQAAA